MTKKTIGALLIVIAIVCGTLAWFRAGHDLERAIQSAWVAFPATALACLLLGLILLTGVKRGFGVLFLLVAATCAVFAYANGGPAWGESFDARRMIRQGGIWAALGALVCLVIGLLMVFGGNKRPQAPTTTS